VASITIQKLVKEYPNGFEAVHNLDLKVHDGEFMVMVGPSGCGKTTVLRMVAGLENISDGVVKIGDRVVNDVSSKDRDLAMVFQNYALYPHMTVAQNIGFALKIRKRSKTEVKQLVESTAEILGLTDWLDRKPGQLSGGQRQRVAMGRAIVREPAAFLMDEPLSNLDAKLRVQMRAEVARIHRRLGVATLYVTHDQVEAMTMGDRVAVLRSGVLQQCDTPQALYDAPANIFVAAFIGSPAMNLFEAHLGDNATFAMIGSQRVELGEKVHALRPMLRSYANTTLVVGVRPQDLLFEDLKISIIAEPSPFEGEVELTEALGSAMLIHFISDARRVEAEGVKDADADGLEAGKLGRSGEGIALVDASSHLVAGARVRFMFDPQRLHFFDQGTGEAIALRRG
jgi:multiple sugar transport system ATP-binding protein